MNEPQLPTPTGVYVSKDTLQLHLRGRQYLLANTLAGYAKLLQLVQAGGAGQLICEATGGYEQGLVAACHATGQLISVVNPARVRHLALAQGQRAKNDPIDATVLTAYGQALRPVAW